MDITASFDDSLADEITSALCSAYEYQDTIDDKPNPENRDDFVIRMLAEYVLNHLQAYRMNQAVQSAADAVMQSMKSIKPTKKKEQL